MQGMRRSHKEAAETKNSALADRKRGVPPVMTRNEWKLSVIGGQNTTRSQIRHAIHSVKSTPTRTSRTRFSPAAFGCCRRGVQQRQAGEAEMILAEELPDS